MKYLIPGILLAAFLILLIKYGIRRVTILEYERGLLYTQGKFRKTLEAGQYWYTPCPPLSTRSTPGPVLFRSLARRCSVRME